jgi:ribosomal protein S6--L-glutamate ligase
MNILVLTTAYQTDLEKAIKDAGHTAEFCNPNEFNMYISESTKGMDSVFKGEQRIFRSTYDCVISRIGKHRGYAAHLIEHLQNNLGIFCVQSGESLNLVADKFRTAQILSQNCIRVPKQVFAMSPKNYKHVIDKVGGLPAILKENTGSQGNGLILLESPQQTNMTLDSFYGSGEKNIIIQRFLNNGGKDERHIVINGEVVSSMERQAPKHDIRSNISREGTGTKIKADAETRELCIKAVAAIEGLNFAGVDVMKDRDGKPYVIEINSNPGTGIIGITGYNHFKDLVRYCERNYRKGMHNAEIAPQNPYNIIAKDRDTQANNNLSWDERWKNYLTNSKYYQALKKEGFF